MSSNVPYAIGITPPLGSIQNSPNATSPDDAPTKILDDIRALTQKIVDGMFPAESMNEVPITITSTVLTQAVQLTQPFNAIIISLSSGILNLYWNNAVGNQYDLQFNGPTGNPIRIPMIRRTEKNILLQSSDGNAVTGVIYFCNMSI